jgi:hypothetical protein
LALLDQFPVVAKAGDEADIVMDPGVGEVTGFDEVDDREQHQRLVGRNAAGRNPVRADLSVARRERQGGMAD